MPQLREYTSQVEVAQPVSGRRATSEDFGGGESIVRAGRALQDAAELTVQRLEREDVRTAHKLAAGLRSKWTVGLAERSKYTESQIIPGATGGVSVGTGPVGIDDRAKPASTGIYSVGQEQVSTTATRTPANLAHVDFADRFMSEMGDDILDVRNQLNTEAGRAQFDVMMENMQGDLRERSFLAQADLAGKKAKSDYMSILDSTRSVLLADPTQMAGVLDELVYSIGSDPNIPAAVRDELARKTRTDLAKSAVQGWMLKSPELAYEKLAAGEFDQHIDADTKAALTNASIKMIEHNEAKALAAQNRADAAARRAKAEAEEDAFKRDYGKLPEFGGNLTMQEVLANSDQYDKADFKTLLDAVSGLSGGGANKGNPATYIALRTAAGKGQDVRGKANAAYRSGDLNREMYDKIVGEVEANSPVAKHEAWHKNGRETIKAQLGGTSLMATGFERQITADALDEFDAWAAKNPDVVPEKGHAQAERILERYRLVKAKILPMPEGVSREREDWDADGVRESWKELEEQRRNNEIGNEEYNRRAKQLLDWDKHFRRQEQLQRRATEQKAKK